MPGHRVEIASGPNGVMPLDDGDPLAVSRAVLPGRASTTSAAQVTTRELRANDRFTIGDITVTMAQAQPPGSGLRLPPRARRSRRSCTRPTPSTSRASIRRCKKLAAGADILIYDSQYTPEEYPAKVGWGHSTWQAGAELARAAGVPQLVLFHHDPRRTDAQLAALEAQARAPRCRARSRRARA